MTNLIKKDQEIRDKLREQTEKLKEAKDKIKGMVVEKFNLRDHEHTSSQERKATEEAKKI